MCFDGSHLRFRFSNLTGTESVHIEYACAARQTTDYQPVLITFDGKTSFDIPAGEELQSDSIEISVIAGETMDVSFYLSDYTQMNAGTLITGPLSKGKFAYGDFARQKDLPLNLSRSTNWVYFLNTIDVLTEETNHALICYGDSITAQSWPDYLALRAWDLRLRKRGKRCGAGGYESVRHRPGDTAAGDKALSKRVGIGRHRALGLRTQIPLE